MICCGMPLPALIQGAMHMQAIMSVCSKALSLAPEGVFKQPIMNEWASFKNTTLLLAGPLDVSALVAKLRCSGL